MRQCISLAAALLLLSLPAAPAAAADAVAPTNVVVTDASSAGAAINAGAVKVQWTGDSNAVAYYISYGSATSATQTKTTLAGQTSIVIDSLQGGDSYSFIVTSKSLPSTAYPTGKETSAAAVSFTPQTVPVAPVVDQATPAKGQVTLTWKAPSNTGGTPLTGYTITYGSSTTTADAGALTKVIPSLTAGVSYSFSIVANNAKGSSPVASFPAVTVPDVPAAPTDVTAAVVDDAVTVSWTASTGTGITYTASLFDRATNTQVLSQAGVTGTSHKFTGVAAATYYAKVVATNDIGDSAASAASADVTVAQKTLTANDPVVTPSTIPDQTIGGNVAISVTVPSGDTPTLSVSPSGVCSLKSNAGNYSIAADGVGTCTLEVSVAASGTYAAGLTTKKFAVLKKTRTVAVSNPTAQSALTIDGTLNAAGTTSPAGGTITWSSQTGAVCTVTSGGLVTAVGAGTCTVRASVAGDATYADATPVDTSFTVAKKSRTVSISGPSAGANLRISDTVTATASTTPSGGTVAWSSATASTCSVDAASGVVTGLAIGTCTIRASVPGNDSFLDATPDTRSITITKRARTVAISAPTVSSNLLMGDTLTAAAATNPSGGALTWTSSTVGVCSIDAGGTITPVAVGKCSVSVTSAATSVYESSTASVTFDVLKRSRAVTLSLDSTGVGVGKTGTATVKFDNIAVAASLVSWSSSDATVCSVSSAGIITGLKAGSCSITATAAADSTYNLASGTSASITVSLNTRTVTVTAPQGFASLPATDSITVTVATGDNTPVGVGVVTWSTTTGSLCSIAGLTATTARVTGLLPGTCSVLATLADDATYKGTSNGISLDVAQKSRSVTIALSAASLTVGGSTVSATLTPSVGDTSTSTVTWSTSTSDTCTVSTSGVITAVSAGTCSISVQVTDTRFLTANATQALTVSAAAAGGGGGGGGIAPKTPVTITIGALADLVAGKSATVSATVSSGGAAVLTAGPASVCSLSGSSVTGIAVGVCTITATTVETTVNLAGSASASFNVVKAPQTITFDAVGTQTAPGSVTLRATSSVGGSVTFSASGDCSASGATVSFTKAGSCTVTASAAATASALAAADVTQTFTITESTKPKAEVKISISASDLTVGSSGSVAAIATDGVAVALSAGPAGVCSLSGGTLSAVAAGTCSISGSFPGDATHLAGAASTTVTVSKRTHTVTLGAIDDQKAPGSVTVSASSSAGLAVALAASGTCTLSGSTLSFSAAGSCTVTATASGDATYQDAAPASETFSIAVPALVAATTVKVQVTATAPISIAAPNINTTVTTLSSAAATVAIKAGTAAQVTLPTTPKSTRVSITVKDAFGKTITTTTTTTTKTGKVALPALKFKSAGTYKIVTVVGGKTRTLTVKVTK